MGRATKSLRVSAATASKAWQSAVAEQHEDLASLQQPQQEVESHRLHHVFDSMVFTIFTIFHINNTFFLLSMFAPMVFFSSLVFLFRVLQLTTSSSFVLSSQALAAQHPLTVDRGLSLALDGVSVRGCAHVVFLLMRILDDRTQAGMIIQLQIFSRVCS